MSTKRDDHHLFKGTVDEVRPHAVARAKELVQMLESGEYKFFLAVAVNEDGYAALGTQVEGGAWGARLLMGIAGLLERFAVATLRVQDASEPRKEGETVQ